MHVTLSRADILQAVQRCQNVVERRHTIPILSNIMIEAEENRLRFAATDLEVGLRTSCPAGVSEPGRLTVSARKLFDILKELDADASIEFVRQENFLQLTSGRSRFRLAVTKADEFPEVSRDEGGTGVDVDGANLAAMITATSFAMSTDETRKYLTGTLFELDRQGNLCLAATDGHRLALTRSRLASDVSPGQCIVPRKAVNEIRKLCEDAGGRMNLHFGERQVSLEAGEHLLVSKLIDARFPNYADVIPSANPHTAIVDRAALDQVLRRTMIVANEFTHDVRLLFRGSELLVSAHNTEQEQVEEVVAIEYQGPDIEIGFNARYIRDVLAAVNRESVEISLKDSLSPVLVKPDAEAAEQYVIMPMRI